MQKRFFCLSPVHFDQGSNSSQIVLRLLLSYQLSLQLFSTSVQLSPSTRIMPWGQALESGATVRVPGAAAAFGAPPSDGGGPASGAPPSRIGAGPASTRGGLGPASTRGRGGPASAGREPGAAA